MKDRGGSTRQRKSKRRAEIKRKAKGLVFPSGKKKTFDEQHAMQEKSQEGGSAH